MILYEEMTCPFCLEDDFDEVGLKKHLLKGHCEAFNAIPTKEGSSTTRSTVRETE